MGAPDYYATLGVARDADAARLKAAYRQMAVQLHPDRRPGDPRATERFQAVVEAWSVLSDPERRRRYDAGEPVRATPVEPGSSLQELFGGILDGLFGVRTKRPVDGRDRRYELTVSLAEVAVGATKTLILPADRPCPHCHGRGFAPGSVPEVCDRCGGAGEVQRRQVLRSQVQDCPACSGRGYVIVEACERCAGGGEVSVPEPLTIAVPAGVLAGERLLIRGAGAPGRSGGRAGDCYVHIDVEAHPVLERDGDDLVMDRPVGVIDAMLGASVRVPTATGSALIDVRPGTRDGTVLKMRGHGVGRRDGSGRGDQRVRVRLELPTRVEAEAAAALRQARDRLGPAAFPESAAFDAALAKGGDDDA